MKRRNVEVGTLLVLSLGLVACSGGALEEVRSTVEDATKQVAESDAYMSDMDRSIEKLISMGNWEMGQSSYVQQEREKIRIEHDELMSRCVALKFEAGKEVKAEGVPALADKVKDAHGRATRHLAKARDFRNAIDSFRAWTERLAANIAVCQTYTNQMHANLQTLTKTKDEAKPEVRDKITLFEARYGALKRGENEATGLARQSLQQFFQNRSVAEAGSKAALDKLSKLQLEIKVALEELQPLLLEGGSAPPPAKDPAPDPAKDASADSETKPPK